MERLPPLQQPASVHAPQKKDPAVFTHCTSRPHPASPLAHSSMSSHVTGMNVGVPAPCAVQLDVPAPSHKIDYQYRHRKAQVNLSQSRSPIMILM
jgi:hypothetical protein